MRIYSILFLFLVILITTTGCNNNSEEVEPPAGAEDVLQTEGEVQHTSHDIEEEEKSGKNLGKSTQLPKKQGKMVLIPVDEELSKAVQGLHNGPEHIDLITLF